MEYSRWTIAVSLWFLGNSMMLANAVTAAVVTPLRFTCPRRCLCSSKEKKVDCREKGLTQVPTDIPRSTRSLLLDMNQISEIRSGLNLSRLENLTLSWNNISYLDKNALIGLPMLRVLKLAHNILTIVDDLFWRKNLHLIQVDMSYNSLSKFSADSFFRLNRLEKMDLSHNFISALNFQESNFAKWNLTDQYNNMYYSTARLQLNLSSNRLNSSDINIFKVLKSCFLALDVSDQPGFTFGTIKRLLVGLKFSKLARLSLRHLKLFYLPQFIFQDVFLPHTKELDLSENFISHLEEHALSTMDQLVHLTLSQNLLSSNPNLISQQRLEFLDLSFNEIAIIHKEFLPHSLKVLHLSGNKFATLTTDVFASLRSLQTLTLSKCNIKELNLVPNSLSGLQRLDVSYNRLYRRYIKPIFTHLRELTELDMSGNALGTLWSNFAQNHPRLRSLNMSRNNIPQLYEVDIGAKNLEVLDLSWNRINILFDYSVPKLKYLYLEHNKISNIDRLAFRNTRDLDLLDLSNNPMRARVVSLWRHVLARLGHKLKVLRMDCFEIYPYLNNDNWRFFTPFHQLEELSLQNCSILALPSRFYNLPNSLRRLDLSGNNIREIGMFTFAKNLKENLREIDLSNNDLSEIKPRVFTHHAHLLRLSVTGNPLICDCHRLPDFLTWALDTNTTISGLYSNSVVCQLPWNRRNQPVTSLDTSHCDSYVDHTPLAAGVTAAFVFLFVASIPYLLGYLIEKRRKSKGTLPQDGIMFSFNNPDKRPGGNVEASTSIETHEL